MSIKIGFNNFKAFGPRMQYYTKKPITLVYGPNSIGKSSFLHSQLLFDSWTDNFSTNLLSNENFAGDTLEIGRFEKYIHKHNKESTINYEVILDDKEDILSYIFFEENSLIKKLNDMNFFEQNLTKEIINSKLESNYKDSNIKIKNLISFTGEIRANIKDLYSQIETLKREFIQRKTTKEELESECKKIENEIDSIIEESKTYMLQKAFCNHFNIGLNEIEVFLDMNKKDSEYFINLYTDFQLNLTKNDEYLCAFIKYSNTFDTKTIIELFNAVKQLINIDNIKYNVIFHDDAKFTTELFMDSQILINREGQIDETSLIYKNIKLINNVRIYKWEDTLGFLLMQHISGSKTAQYFGPLRPYPKKEDMLQIDKDVSTVNSKEDIFFSRKQEYVIGILRKYKLTIILLLWPKFFRGIMQTGGFNRFLSLAKKVTAKYQIKRNPKVRTLFA